MRIGDGTAGEERIVLMFGVWCLELNQQNNKRIGPLFLDARYYIPDISTFPQTPNAKPQTSEATKPQTF